MSRYVREAVIKYRRSQVAVPSEPLASPENVYEMIVQGDLLPDGPQERMVAIAVDVRNNPLGWTIVGVGGLAACPVEPRTVFCFALLLGASSIFLAHNHPSGDCTPSPEDVEVTRRMKAAGELIGIHLLDHLVIGDGNYRSAA